MSSTSKSKVFAELVISMTNAERIGMAIDVLMAIENDNSLQPKLVSATEAKRVGEVLLNLAHEIEMHYPGGHSW